jgi:predicted MPP superfamily phosphohydrolase
LGVVNNTFRSSFWVVTALPAILVPWAFWIEPSLLVTRESRLEIARWPEDVRIAVLSDLHVGSAGVPIGQLRNIVERTNSQHPDLVVLLGDYVIGGPQGNQDSRRRHFVPPEPIAEELKHLRAPLGVFAVLGNHDWWFDGERIARALTGAGITVLENQAVPVNGHGFSIGGIADLWTRVPDVAGTLSQIDDAKPVILITHNPDIFPTVPARVGLTIAGHTHGGQVRLPFYGPLIKTSEFGYDAGLFVDQGRHLFVTTGIGTSIMDVRFGVPPEIVILTLTAPRARRAPHIVSTMMYQAQTRFQDHSPNDRLRPGETRDVH